MRLEWLMEKFQALFQKIVAIKLKRTESKKPFRLLFIAPQPFYEDRGTPIVILEELKCLSDLGYDIDVLTYPLGKGVFLQGTELIRVRNPLKITSIPIGFSWSKVILDIQLALKAFQLARKTKYTCVHGVEEGAAICLLLKWLHGIPMVYDMHSSIPEQLSSISYFSKGPGAYLAKLVEKLLIRNSNIIMASKGLAPLINGIDPTSVIKEWIFENCPPNKDSKKIENQLGIMGRPVVAYVGNFAQYQGVELLIDAILKVREMIDNVVLLLVGGTENEIAGLEKKVVSLKLSNNVILIPRVERDKVPEYLSIADVLSLPRPRGENAPLKIYEYKKSGKPIVATNIPAHELIANNSTSIMVAPEVGALVDGIMHALKNGKPSAEENEISGEFCFSQVEALPEILSDVYNTIIANSC